MKKNKKNRFLIIIILFIVIMILIPNNSKAALLEEVFNDADSFLQASDSGNVTTIQQDDVKNVSSMLYNTLYYGGMAVSGIIAAYLGLKIAFTSVGEKAKVMESLLPYVVGCVIIFASLGIWKIAVKMIPDDVTLIAKVESEFI